MERGSIDDLLGPGDVSVGSNDGNLDASKRWRLPESENRWEGIAGRSAPRWQRERFEIVGWEQILAPQYLFRCPLRERLYPPPASRWGDHLAAARAYTESVDPIPDAQLRPGCTYHQHDWHAAAVIATETCRATGPIDGTRIAAITQNLRATAQDAHDAYMLLHTPLRWSDNGFIDGIHRACALRHARVPEVPIMIYR